MPRAKTSSLLNKHRDSVAGRRFTSVQATTGALRPTNARFRAARDFVTPAIYRSAFRQLYAFFFLEMSLLLVWIAYRSLVQMPTWFDEGVAKALVFGLPAFWLAARSRFVANEIGLDPQKLLPGLYMGLAVGGLYGFVGMFLSLIGGQKVMAAPFYTTPQFWTMAGLALLTAWWESLFFFGLTVSYLRSIASWFSDSVVGGFVVLLFLLFHAPLRFLIAGVSPQFLVQMGILMLFAIGQFLLYTRTKNLYSIVLSHLFWGLVIEIYSR